MSYRICWHDYYITKLGYSLLWFLSWFWFCSVCIFKSVNLFLNGFVNYAVDLVDVTFTIIEKVKLRNSIPGYFVKVCMCIQNTFNFATIWTIKLASIIIKRYDTSLLENITKWMSKPQPNLNTTGFTWKWLYNHHPPPPPPPTHHTNSKSAISQLLLIRC